MRTVVLRGGPYDGMEKKLATGDVFFHVPLSDPDNYGGTVWYYPTRTRTPLGNEIYDFAAPKPRKAQV